MDKKYISLKTNVLEPKVFHNHTDHAQCGTFRELKSKKTEIEGLFIKQNIENPLINNVLKLNTIISMTFHD
ncbi:hypothetical protein [Kaistella sp.]|uniref:hypothetical protein n=1 Tax=Kaistella sp. TaxID=2782235 RepID=UPI002F94DBB1